jgi:hypothetical protein
VAQFQDHEKKMRVAARTALHSKGDSSDAKESNDFKDGGGDAKSGPTQWSYAGSEEEKAQPKQEGAPGGPGSKATGGAGPKLQFKPAWSMTEKAAEGQDEELQLGEEEQLLDFARSLDFDRYIGDVEVQAVMERLRRRIADLERDVAQEDTRSADAETRAALRAKLEQMVTPTCAWSVLSLRR